MVDKGKKEKNRNTHCEKITILKTKCAVFFKNCSNKEIQNKTSVFIAIMMAMIPNVEKEKCFVIFYESVKWSNIIGIIVKIWILITTF